MKTVRIIPIAVLLTFVLLTAAHGGSVTQSSWWAGPGYPGPNTYFGNMFDTQSNMSWNALDGVLFLGVSSTRHIISNTIDGLRFAFPADVDGDGDTDVVGSEIWGPTSYKVLWFENDGTGAGWIAHKIHEYYSIFSAYPADVDADGDIDIVGFHSSASSNEIVWWRNEDGIGETWSFFYIQNEFNTGFISCADIIGNDTLEVVATTWVEPHQIAWWEASAYPPDSSWNKHVVTGGIDRGIEIVPIDLDLDGDIDIVSADEDWYGLKWFENDDGSGLSWTSHQIGGMWDTPNSAHAADIDSDGDIDVVYCNQDYEEASWFENLNGSGTSWQEHVIDGALNYPVGIHSADLTDDGYCDVFLADWYGLDLNFYRNMDGSGTEWAKYHLDSNPYRDVDVADFDGDGRLDILAAASGVDELSWHELTGHTSGWLESSIFDVTYYPRWDSITWVAEEPPGTELFFQLRSSGDWEEMGSWCDTIFQSGSLEGYIDSTHRYIQYRVGMTADTAYRSPILDEVRIYWTNLGIEGGGEDIEFSLQVFPNPSAGAVNVAVPAFFAEGVALDIYDLAGRHVRSLESDTNVFQWDGHDQTGNAVPSGLYIVRGRFEDRMVSARLVKI